MQYLIVGNGVAGTTAAEHIRRHDATGDIVLVTAEDVPFYSRIRLIDYLAGKVDEHVLHLKKPEWYDEFRINLQLNTRISSIDNDKKAAYCETGKKLAYDRLLLATGSDSFVPPIQGVNKKGVFTFRTLRDAKEIRKYAQSSKKVIVLGGGVLGLEAGNSLRKIGCEITVVEFFDRLLPVQMDPAGGEILKTQLEEMGFRFFLGARSKEIVGENSVSGLILEDGRQIDCDMIILSAGVRPSMALAKSIGLQTDRGVIVNDFMQTSQPNIYAAGDVAQHGARVYGIWPAAMKQGETAGINMAGEKMEFQGMPMSYTLKIAEIDLVAVGNIDPDDGHEAIVKKDQGRFLYQKIVLEEDRIIGAILYGDISPRRNVINAINSKEKVSASVLDECRQGRFDNL